MEETLQGTRGDVELAGCESTMRAKSAENFLAIANTDRLGPGRAVFPSKPDVGRAGFLFLGRPGRARASPGLLSISASRLV